ncbi:63 kDa sperm flagellar membrane protein [Harpegnathos saltator]|uniref:63 kDa sperm flagellar membrane protein n=2 Tax=Harpegnathos saltator TaxID=610380 RepID=E2BVR0_HARSA|nr:63 kDa sperm flagellar membrane protein [Harpegnathos saltator]
MPAFQLESSKSVNGYDSEETRFVFTDASRDEPIDELTSSKHVAHIDGNNIEVKPGEYYQIVPTTSESMSGEGRGAPQRADLLSEPHQLVGAPLKPRSQPSSAVDQQRRGRQEIPRIYSEHASAPPILQTAAPGHRQANPDIQDIITGIVKLLNGNVNVAANTVRPLRPVQATRINNRGPPRISDVPPLALDFDTPGMNPPPPPSSHPYPFEKPPAPDRPSLNQLPPDSTRPVRPFISGVPVPEQIVPPWSWDSSHGGVRRPPLLHKPLPPLLDSSFHRDKNFTMTENSQYDLKPETEETPQESSTKKKDASQLGAHTNDHRIQFHNTTNDKDVIESTAIVDDSGLQNVTKKPEAEEPTRKNHKQQPSSDDNKVNAEETLILGVATDNVNPTHSTRHPAPSKTTMSSSSQTKVTKPSKSEDKTSATSKGEKPAEKTVSAVSKTATKTFSTSTLNIETSSSVQVIESTPTKVVLRPTAAATESNDNFKSSVVSLEPSRASDIEYTTPASSVSTPTEGLPTSYSKSSATVDKSAVHPATSVFTKNTGSTEHYRPRPGIVLDDTLDYTGAQRLPSQRPYVPSRHPPAHGDVFDVTVSAIQGPGGSSGESVRVSVNPAGGDVILTTAVGGQGYVSIDGKRTYLNLFDNTDRTPAAPTHVQPQPTRTQPPAIVGTGLAIPQPDAPVATSRPNGSNRRQPPLYRRPTQPPVRIDTCIVGDTSTCDASQHEACATVQGVSACHCKPGYARLQHSLPCKKIVSIVVSIRVDKFYNKKIVWDRGLADKDSESYQTLAYEANRAVESAMSMTPFSDEYMGSQINNVYQGDVSQGQGGVFVNTTLKLTYEPRTIRPSLAGELQRHLLGVIHRRNNNIGNSALYVDSPPGSISNLQDLDECASSELNDCHSSASCSNIFGGFTCSCNPGLKDPHKDDPNESGRTCLSCPSTYCNNRGSCSYQGDQMQCACTGNYYGAQCEVDGEVLGVAIGASVAALIIIVLTLVCLVMWSRRWSREQKSVGSPVYGYIQSGIPGTLPGTLARVGSVGTLASVKQGPPTNLPPYMWAHFGEHMATANVYATEPMGPTRPSSAMFGYPSMNVHGTLPPVPLPRLQAPPRPRQRPQPDPDSSDSEPQDKDRADLIPQSSGFHVPRPKSRSSLANQSGIYNDVEYDQGDVHHLSKNNIPMSTYRPYYRT